MSEIEVLRQNRQTADLSLGPDRGVARPFEAERTHMPAPREIPLEEVLECAWKILIDEKRHGSRRPKTGP